MKTVCALIVNYGSYQDTVDYVSNLKTQKGITLSILLVDNHSPGHSFEKLVQEYEGDPAVEVLQSAYNGGYAYGNNVGLRHLEDREIDFLLISNNDIYLDDDHLLKKLVGVFPKLDKPAFVAPCMYVNGLEDQKHQAWKLPTYWDDLRASLRLWYFLANKLGRTNDYQFEIADQNPRDVQCLSGSFFMGQKATFYQLDLFDENTFLYGEESILGQKVKAAGLNNYLIRSLRFDHVLGQTTGRFYSMIQLRKYWLQSTLYYQKKYNEIGRGQVFILQLFFVFWIFETGLLRGIRFLQQFRWKRKG
ncbi:MAG: hypothetical protein DHS20C18_15780 [Saprospiraceae bacterium]|nr:MAG: hypothetical protein DHS20C18_15780 [Saprospiraceae bacterium]